MLEAALERFERHSRVATGDGAAGVLWLLETNGAGASERLRRVAAPWRCRPSDGVVWRLATDEARVEVVFGRQLVTTEGLEVLVVGTREEPGRTRPLADTVEGWIDRDVVVVIPWGLGKWTGRRGRLVEAAIERFGARGLRLADTAMRSPWLPAPAAFARSEQLGFPVLAGTDPFPFVGQEAQAGRAGFVLEKPGDSSWDSVRRYLAEADAGGIRRYVHPLTLPTFLALQLRMQWRKRRSRGGSSR